jgi:septal ring factor EnvC (AmiA/AmiB activator)
MNGKAKRTIMAALLAHSIPLPTMMAAAFAQDIPGIEICTRERQIDRRVGCLQSNIEFLQQLITRQALDAQQKLGAANRDIAALKDSLAGASREIGPLKESLAGAGRDIAALRESVAATQAKTNELQKTPPIRSPGR